MAKSAIKIEGLDKLTHKIDDLEKLKGVKVAMRGAAEHVKSVVSKYPPDDKAHRPQPFVSDRQRRGFFARLRAGLIEVPYRRGQSPGSMDHSSRWNVQERDSGLTQVIGANTGYGPLLQDASSQTPYHKKTGWKTIQTVALEEADKVNKFIKDEIDKVLRR